MAIEILEQSFIQEILERAENGVEILVVADNARTHSNHKHSQPNKRSNEQRSDVAPRIPRRKSMTTEAQVEWNPSRWESSSPKNDTKHRASFSTKQDYTPVLKSRSFKKSSSTSYSLLQLQKQNFQELRRRANKEKVDAILKRSFSTSVLSSSPRSSRLLF